VLSIDPKGKPSVLILSNGDSLPLDLQIRRVQEKFRGNMIPHQGIFRQIMDCELERKKMMEQLDSIGFGQNDDRNTEQGKAGANVLKAVKEFRKNVGVQEREEEGEGGE